MDEFLTQKIDELKQKNLYRSPKGEWGDGWLNFSTNDYLGLAKHPEVIAASVAAAEKFGAGAVSSRLLNGNHPLYPELEKALAQFKGAEDCAVCGSGYLANLGVMKALVGKGDLILADKLSHSSLIEAADLSHAKMLRFKHNDMQHLRELLQSKRGEYDKCLIVTEEIFSMDGDFGDLQGLAALRDEFDCWLLVDGAHSIYDGKNVHPLADIYVGTMSKALACYGGYVTGSKVLVEYLKATAKTFIYSTALPPSVVGSALAALEVARRDKPYVKLLENVKNFGGKASPIIPLIIGGEEETLQIAEKLKQQKIIVSAIRPPTVPPNTSRLRLSLSAEHSAEDVEILKGALNELSK